MHRDVKGHNILLTTDGRVKMIDFGETVIFNPNCPYKSKVPPYIHLLTSMHILIGIIINLANRTRCKQSTVYRTVNWRILCYRSLRAPEVTWWASSHVRGHTVLDGTRGQFVIDCVNLIFRSLHYVLYAIYQSFKQLQYIFTYMSRTGTKLQKSGSYYRCNPVLQLRTFQSVCLLPPGNRMWAAAWLHLWRQVWRLVARRYRNRTGWRSTTLRWPSPDARAVQDPQVNARFVVAMVLVWLVYWLNNLFQRWHVRTCDLCTYLTGAHRQR